ncbi:lincosamide nucleotidyltransferase A/C/D/E [Nocardioides sp. BE266]|uniref:nucleotidyltransferase domain-containing protein n=1 Tax=Nocardioides sp. BE266 TaxID=2817725 RepID=UPI002854D518|nr:nucleotidyltransferase family protein [Nocardioides sp. BE266]MDR7251367.1 lincosamide nucleotidyltransferase A/C/D/E [Nocardioides sp. BE266]
MDAQEVRRVLDALDAADVGHCLAGGWGVDALVGEQTREHRDLDLLVDAEDFDRARDVLDRMGYRPETDWLPVRLEVAAAGLRWVDLHPVVMDDDGNGVQQGLDGTTYTYPREVFTLGVVDGRLVPCVTAELQREVHQGYELRPQDEHDLRQLERLG